MKNKIFEKLNGYLSSRVVFLFFVFIVVNVVANINSYSLFVDILSQFKVQYFYIGILFTIAFLYLCFVNKKFTAGAVLSVLITGFNYIDTSSSYREFHLNCVTRIPENNLKIGLFNVLTSNDKYHLLLKEIKTNNPDIVILQEVDKNWLQNFGELKENYPNFIEYPREDNFGIAIYSKMPLSDKKIEYWSNHEIPVISTKIQKGNKIIKIYGIHTLPPTSKSYILTRNEMLTKIGEILGQASIDKEHIIVAGDLNTTFFSKAYSLANPPLNSAVIHDALRYAPKFKGSWNTAFVPFLRITLEHILSTGDIQPINAGFGESIGSDHLPVFAEFDVLNF